MPPGTGVFLNNEMDDFSMKPGVANGYQLLGGEANAIAPGKRMLSSMTPTILLGEDGLAVLGTPGGSRIITMVFLASLAWFDGADATTMVSLPRIHHQYSPDRIGYEGDAHHRHIAVVVVALSCTYLSLFQQPAILTLALRSVVARALPQTTLFDRRRTLHARLVFAAID